MPPAATGDPSRRPPAEPLSTAAVDTLVVGETVPSLPMCALGPNRLPRPGGDLGGCGGCRPRFDNAPTRGGGDRPSPLRRHHGRGRSSGDLRGGALPFGRLLRPRDGHAVDHDPRDLRDEVPPGAGFALSDLPLDKASYFNDLSRRLADHLYRSRSVTLFRNKGLKLYSRVGETVRPSWCAAGRRRRPRPTPRRPSWRRSTAPGSSRSRLS